MRVSEVKSVLGRTLCLLRVLLDAFFSRAAGDAIVVMSDIWSVRLGFGMEIWNHVHFALCANTGPICL